MSLMNGDVVTFKEKCQCALQLGKTALLKASFLVTDAESLFGCDVLCGLDTLSKTCQDTFVFSPKGVDVQVGPCGTATDTLNARDTHHKSDRLSNCTEVLESFSVEVTLRSEDFEVVWDPGRGFWELKWVLEE